MNEPLWKTVWRILKKKKKTRKKAIIRPSSATAEHILTGNKN